ncbi:cerebellin 20 [Antennarius striatus]|uniref:cerebellin 20 n=1 Tax=Antennarius striatus TaxID=241820 RepID=UPI0035B4C67F
MQAIVFLCLLEAAFIHANVFSWGKQEESDNGGDTPGNACLTDSGSCGCCLMQQQIHKMKEFFNTTLKEMEQELEKTQTILNNVRGSRSAYSVALTNENRLKCFGPFRDDKIVTYKHIFINMGNSYNPDTGVFTVPRSGVYNLALTIYSDAGSPGNTLAACAGLQVNGRLLAGPRELNMQDQEDSATIVLAVHLKAGDRVSVNLPIGCFLCDNSSHYNTFSGFLLYSTD